MVSKVLQASRTIERDALPLVRTTVSDVKFEGDPNRRGARR
jgi:hypothetical protein